MRYLIREACLDDRLGLKKLSESFLLCNLPNDLDEIDSKIQTSQDSFKKNIPKEKRIYIFVLEDIEQKKIIGSSQIIAAYGDINCPYFEMNEKDEKKYLKLSKDPEGKYQIGGLVLLSEYRGTKDKLGALVTKIRYLYMGAYPDDFSEKIEVNLTGPFEKKNGKIFNAFWNEVGKKYYNIDYEEALLEFSKKGSQFFENFPKDLVVPFDDLSLEAQKSVESVHPQTEPAFKALKKLGFTRKGKHHFLDGAIYISAFKKDISIVTGTKSLSLCEKESLKNKDLYFVGQQTKNGFMAGVMEGCVEGDKFCFESQKNFLDLEQKVFVSLFSS